MSDVSLCSPLRLGPYALSHRVVMAPVTRMRAQQPGYVLGEVPPGHADRSGNCCNSGERQKIKDKEKISFRFVQSGQAGQ